MRYINVEIYLTKGYVFLKRLSAPTENELQTLLSSKLKEWKEEGIWSAFEAYPKETFYPPESIQKIVPCPTSFGDKHEKTS